MHAKSLQSGPTLCDSTDNSPPGSSVYRILQARTLEWVAISFSEKPTYILIITLTPGCWRLWGKRQIDTFQEESSSSLQHNPRGLCGNGGFSRLWKTTVKVGTWCFWQNLVSLNNALSLDYILILKIHAVVSSPNRLQAPWEQGPLLPCT